MTNEQLVIAIQQGDTDKTAELWQNSYKWLYNLAYQYYTRLQKRFISSGVTLEDLQQECYFIFLGMVKAYDPEKEYKFTSYADLQFKCRLRVLLGICNGKDIAPLNSASSFDEKIKGTDDLSLADSVEDKNAAADFETAEDSIFNHELAATLERMMNDYLTHRQKGVIIGRFYNNMRLCDLGVVYGVSNEVIRADERNALRTFRNHKRDLEPFREHFISDHAFKYTSAGSFRERLASSQELIIELMEREEKLRFRQGGISRPKCVEKN